MLGPLMAENMPAVLHGLQPMPVQLCSAATFTAAMPHSADIEWAVQSTAVLSQRLSCRTHCIGWGTWHPQHQRWCNLWGRAHMRAVASVLGCRCPQGMSQHPLYHWRSGHSKSRARSLCSSSSSNTAGWKCCAFLWGILFVVHSLEALQLAKLD